MFRWYLIAFVTLSGVTPVALATDPPKKLTAEALVKKWTPELDKDGASYNRTGGSPKGSPDVAGHTFSYKGMSLEEVWNFYAEKCGMKERYKEKNFLISTGSSDAGEYVVSGQPVAGDKSAAHGVTMFLLKTPEYTVAVSFHLDPDGKTILGSIAAVVK